VKLIQPIKLVISGDMFVACWEQVAFFQLLSALNASHKCPNGFSKALALSFRKFANWLPEQDQGVCQFSDFFVQAHDFANNRSRILIRAHCDGWAEDSVFLLHVDGNGPFTQESEHRCAILRGEVLAVLHPP
jgi:hypothetical protein